MLTPLQSQRAVIWSIHAISGKTAKPGQKLKTAGLPSQDLVDAMISVLTLSRENGVPYYQHTIDPTAFNSIDPSSTVTEVAVIVQQEAKP